MELDPVISFGTDPISQFQDWLDLAAQNEINDPNAMSLATVDAEGRPSVRIVLMKSVDAAGFRFYTNLASRKAHEVMHNPHAALCFHWKSLQRQVRVEGALSRLEDIEADRYFASRHRISQLGAWASLQSHPLEDMNKLTERLIEFEKKFADETVIPRPPHWGGFLLAPRSIEFWAERPHRLHERMLYVREDNGWQMQRLYP